MNKEEVVEYLWNIKNKDEIHELWNILKGRSRQLEEQLTYAFNVGNKVYFNNKGIKTEGIIEKVNRKSISVKVGEFAHWNVSPSLLTKVE